MSEHYMPEFATKTDVGMLREQNEDTVLIDESLQLAILADGMGGHNAGEVASSLAVVAIQEELESQSQDFRQKGVQQAGPPIHQWLTQAVHQANIIILNAAQREPMYRGMGTTLVLAWFRGDSVSIAHVGDSRAYRYRDGCFEQLTHDHSLLQEQIDAGLVRPEDAQFSPNRNIITRAVGVDYDLVVDVQQHLLQPGDLYLLCSDGLSDRIASEELGHLLHQLMSSTQGDLNLACHVLVQIANERGGQDNVSVILIKIPKCGASASIS